MQRRHLRRHHMAQRAYQSRNRKTSSRRQESQSIAGKTADDRTSAVHGHAALRPEQMVRPDLQRRRRQQLCQQRLDVGSGYVESRRLRRRALRRRKLDAIRALSRNPEALIPGRCEAANPEFPDSGPGADAPSRNDGEKMAQERLLTMRSKWHQAGVAFNAVAAEA